MIPKEQLKYIVLECIPYYPEASINITDLVTALWLIGYATTNEPVQDALDILILDRMIMWITNEPSALRQYMRIRHL